jgi:hypothetical protein
VVKRTEIAIQGAPSHGTLRLELTGAPGEDGLVLEFLHDDRQTGTLARVLSGRVGLGEVSVPVAVKLQRDIALSQEDRGSVAAKFDKERNVHRRLQDAANGAGQDRIVRQLEVWSGPAEHEADSLEPCIVCARARHGLAPRCPECDDPAAVLEELQLTDDYGLRCNRCHRQFWSTPKTRDAILAATLRHDPACQGCPLEKNADANGCRQAAAFLNFFRNRVLLLERLDLDLDDYLRWRRGLSAAGVRQRARQAFDEHQRLLQERQAQLPSPPVARIASLRAITDLFAEILTGVEHLHQHGVAHLDLKPANVCLRFRGADLDVKVIDLGLSDDPNTLAYLRQAEGPISLWTDYSAPEFRRPRGRPLTVNGRFREDACELDWPVPDSPAPETPVSGDLIFFEDKELQQQRFRVVQVRTGRDGRLQVQARAEPQHHLWTGATQTLAGLGPEARTRNAVSVALEKHCGFAADIYSLGMLLVAVLGGQPDVGDFREGLASVQIELEEYLRDRPPLPSRALVQWLLSKQSRHLQVFHAFAHRLSWFGAAQPLAEELLGIALRALLRGDSRSFYLAHRGADARPALRRLRADLEAVRQALGNALTAAQASTVREARLAVLDQLRGRLKNLPVDSGTLPRSDPGGRLLYPALDMGAAGGTHRDSELAYLPADWQPDAALDRWERELGGQSSTGGGERNWDFLVRYCRHIDASTASASQFLECFRNLEERVRQAARTTDPTHSEEREQLCRWLEKHRELAERLTWGKQFARVFRQFLASLCEKFLLPWDRALRVKQFFVFKRQRAAVSLTRGERRAVCDADAVTALQQLVEKIQQGARVHEQRRHDFQSTLARWRTWCAGRSWLEALSHLEADAIRQHEEIEAASNRWEQEWTTAVSGLRRCLEEIQLILRPYAPLLTAEATLEEITASLSRLQREGLKLRATEPGLRWLEENWPTVADRVEAVFALWEISGLPEPRLNA